MSLRPSHSTNRLTRAPPETRTPPVCSVTRTDSTPAAHSSRTRRASPSAPVPRRLPHTLADTDVKRRQPETIPRLHLPKPAPRGVVSLAQTRLPPHTESPHSAAPPRIRIRALTPTTLADTNSRPGVNVTVVAPRPAQTRHDSRTRPPQARHDAVMWLAPRRPADSTPLITTPFSAPVSGLRRAPCVGGRCTRTHTPADTNPPHPAAAGSFIPSRTPTDTIPAPPAQRSSPTHP
ncbi:hypothetical protein K438DRAFT_1969086 [Mycena galopus ATCC 62051]|nr:hypothetical protein K438DRAFT_1969086 [Mycena galopus ATCC 62051]